MASTYTLNNGIELIGTGEQSGTWGDTTNTNLSLLDTALDGQVTVTLATAGTSGSPNALPISDGSASDGRNRMIIFADGGDLGATAYVQLTPNDAEKIIYIRNDLSGSRSILFFQGTYNASNDYEVPAGTTAVIYFDGGGTGAVAANVFNNAYFDSLRLGSLSVTAILDEDDMSSDSATALATQQSIKKYVDDKTAAQNELSEVLANGNTSGGNDIQMTTTDELQFRDTALKISSSADGQLDIDADTEIEIVAPTVDIDASTAMTIDTAALTVTGAVDLNTSLNVDGTVTSDGLTVAGNVSVDGGTIKLDGNYPNGTGNVALGDTALDTLTTGGNYNIAIGHNNSTALTTGDNNVSLGAFALTTTTTSSSNTAIGYSALELNVTGAGNVALGNKSMEEGITADNNTAVGNQAGRFLSDEIVATSIVSGVNYTIQTSGSTDFTLIGAADSNPGTTFTATGAGTGTGTASANAQLNTFVGYKSAELVVGGSKNTVLGLFNGNQNTIDIRNSDNNIVLSDGDGNPRLAYVEDNRELVINEQSADVDFRVESDNETHMLFVDASTDRIGIGTNAPSVPLHVSTSLGGQAVIIESTRDDASYGPDLTLYRNSPSPADSDGIGRIRFRGKNDADEVVDYVILQSYIRDVTDGTEDGAFRFEARSAGDLREIITYANEAASDGELIFNNDGREIDFRVESEGNANMLFVDAENDAVGIGTSAAGSFSIGDLVVGNGSGARGITIYSGNSSGIEGIIRFADGVSGSEQYRGQIKYDQSIDAMKILVAGTGGTTPNIQIFNTETIFNEGGLDRDFRVESDTNTHAFVIDGQYGNVGIKRTSPSYDLDINGAFRTVYSVPAYSSTTGTGSSSDYWKLGTVSNLVGSRSMKIRILGTSSYSAGGNIAGETTILFRANNAGTTTNGTFWSETQGNNHVAAVAWKQTGTNDQFDIWVKWASSFAGTDIFVETAGQWVFDISNTGSTSQPSGSTLISPRKANYIGDRLALNLQTTEVAINETSHDMDFRVESDSSTHMIFVDAANNAVNIGTSVTTANRNFQVASNFPIRLETSSAPDSYYTEIGNYYDYNKSFVLEHKSHELMAFSDGNGLIIRGNTSPNDGQIRFYPDSAAADGRTGVGLSLTTDEAVFNQAGQDKDFRVESDANANCFKIDASADTGQGTVLFGQNVASSATTGGYFSNSGSGFFHLVVVNSSTTSTHACLYLNRQSADGNLVEFRQADTQEGTISVSGSTVSYNGFAGRHESSGIPTTTVKGTVVSTIDELDVYVSGAKQGQTRADHAKVKISDTAGESCVYGVVDDFTEDGKVNVISVGIGAILVTGSCSKGDLLESNGDGTAKVQSDDIVRSKTLGKVTIGNSDTGVKLVSCVMYCG